MEDDNSREEYDLESIENIYQMTGEEVSYRLGEKDLHPGLTSWDQFFSSVSGKNEVFIAGPSYIKLISGEGVDESSELHGYTQTNLETIVDQSDEFEITNWDGRKYKIGNTFLYPGKSFEESIRAEIPVELTESDFRPLENIELRVPTWKSFREDSVRIASNLDNPEDIEWEKL